MGNICGSGLTGDEAKAKQASNKIDHELAKSKKEQKKEVKLLLLGAGDSGKSTVAKQMQILHLDGFSQDEMIQQKPLIYHNLIDSAQKLIRAAKDFTLSLESCEEEAEFVLGLDVIGDVTFAGQVADSLKAVWRDSAIQEAYGRSAEYQLNDTAHYFFESIDRIAQPDYLPDNNDMLRVRKKTTGVLETRFETGGLFFRCVKRCVRIENERQALNAPQAGGCRWPKK